MHRKHQAPRFRSYTKDEIINLPIMSYEGPIEVIASDADAERACSLLSQSALLGFDTETKPAFRKGEHYLPSLIQLADSTAVYIFQLRKIQEYAPMAALLGSASPRKVGVAVRDDILHLNKIFEFDGVGFIDLRSIATEMGIENNGLRNLAASILGKRISKRAQTSNWAAPNLAPFQIQYAAVDAWACREIYLTLQQHD